MRSRRCETCRFVSTSGVPKGSGYCHRAPPRALDPGTSTFAPVSLTRYWCGEWKLAWGQFFKLFKRKE